MEKARQKGVKLYLPVDCVCASEVKGGIPTAKKTVQEIPADLMALDIGPASIELFDEALADCGTIVWNGPMGVFEIEEFASGTIAIGHSLAGSKALTIVGGGDTDAALHAGGVIDQIDFVSTAGGAFLEMLSGKVLPGVAALDK